MSRSKQTSKGRGRRRVVAALGVAGALSLAGGASASISPARDLPTQDTAPAILGEEEMSDVSLATFYVFDKENAGAHRSGAQFAAQQGAANKEAANREAAEAREAANREAANREAVNREAAEAVEARAVEATEAVGAAEVVAAAEAAAAAEEAAAAAV